jgi:hypothetical protein
MDVGKAPGAVKVDDSIPLATLTSPVQKVRRASTGVENMAMAAVPTPQNYTSA